MAFRAMPIVVKEAWLNVCQSSRKCCCHVIEVSQWQALLQLITALNKVRLGLCWCNGISL